MKGVVFKSLGSEPTIEDADVPKPASDQVLVKSLYTAMNPVDAMVPAMGILVVSWPVGLGCDASGVVEAVGEEAQAKYGFKKGDYVCGCTRVGWAQEYTTARDYFLMDAPVTMKRPSGLSAAEACTIGGAFQTASLALFSGLHIDPNDASEKDEWVLIFGGAGSVGGAGVQLASALGYKVIATCSAGSSARTKGYGAKITVDYRQDLSKQLKAVMDATGRNVTKIFDATSADDPALAKSVFRVSSAAEKLFSTTNDWSGVGDFEGGKTYEIHLGLIGREEAVEINTDLEKYNNVIVALFESGKLKPQESKEIGSGGLEDAIKAFKHKGDSGIKVIVKIQDE